MRRKRSRGWARTSCAGSSARSRRTGTCCSGSDRGSRSSGSCSPCGTRPASSRPTAASPAWEPRWADLEAASSDAPLDRWLVDRTSALVEEATAAYESFLTVDVVRAFDAFVDDLSNWYIRRSRRRFWDGDEAALATLWHAIVQALRVIAPVMPFLTEHLWQALVRDTDGAPDSVHLAGWPAARETDHALLAEVAQVRRVVELGRRARSAAGIANRQPLGRLAVFGAPLAAAHADEIAEELRVEDVRFEAGEAARVRFKPNLPVLGPRLGKQLPAIRAALESGDYELDGDVVLVEGERLSGDDLLRERTPVHEGWHVAAEGEASVELDPSLDEGCARRAASTS